MKVRFGELEIEYQVSGSGPWVTMAHALGCDLSMWEPQVKALQGRYTVLRYDIRGHGGSTPKEGPYAFADLVADVRALLESLGVERTHFVGLSLGGMIGQHLALAAPGKLLSLTLASTTSRYPPEVLPVWAERLQLVAVQGMEPLVAPTLARWFTEPYREAHPELMARIATLLRRTSVAGYRGCGACIPRINLTAQLPAIRLPSLVLAGEQDLGTPPAMAEEIAQAIPGARLEVLADASHLCNLEQADDFNRLLQVFLAEVAGVPGRV